MKGCGGRERMKLTDIVVLSFSHCEIVMSSQVIGLAEEAWTETKWGKKIWKTQGENTDWASEWMIPAFCHAEMKTCVLWHAPFITLITIKSPVRETHSDSTVLIPLVASFRLFCETLSQSCWSETPFSSSFTMFVLYVLLAVVNLRLTFGVLTEQNCFSVYIYYIFHQR